MLLLELSDLLIVEPLVIAWTWTSNMSLHGARAGTGGLV